MTPEDNSPTATISINGNPVIFSKLSLDDVYVKILGEQKKLRKKELIENLKLMEIPKEEWLDTLRDFDEETVEMDQFIKLVNSGAGKLMLTDFAWKKANPDAGKSGEKLLLSEGEMMDVLSSICAGIGLTFGGNAPPPDKAALAYGQEGGGAENPPPAAYSA